MAYNHKQQSGYKKGEKKKKKITIGFVPAIPEE
jgi:hypothetical protein